MLLTKNQIQSFETELSVPELASKEGGAELYRGVFIRAPAILDAGPDVQVLADYPLSSKELDSVAAFQAQDQEVCRSSFDYRKVIFDYI